MRTYTRPAHAVALAHRRQDALLSAVALGLIPATAFAALAVGWQLGGVALHMLGMGS